MMGKIFELKKWVTLLDARKYLSIVLGEEVSEADLLRLALDGHLILSVNFVNKARAKQGRFIPLEEATVTLGMPIENKEPFDVLYGVIVIGDQILKLEEKVVVIDGVWDLPMIGNERLDIEHEYQSLTNGPAVTLSGLDGVFVKNRDGTLYELQEHYGDNEFADKKQLEKPWGHPNNFYPAGCLPEDSVLVVRTDALRQFEQSLNDASLSAINGGHEERETEKPLGTRERTTLYTIMGLLAREAKIDYSQPSAAAAVIKSAADIAGVEIGQRTIEEHLKRIPDALERRGKSEA